ncbi:MAG: peptide ABC transporter substrate-binding protein [Clostridia bacterium]|nr:peptide ABC transporter substrate-binding protein [Clostridia bacterium]
MKKRISLLLILALLLAAASGCSGKGDLIFYAAVEAPAMGYDPQTVSDDTGRMIVRSCYEGLVTVAADGAVRPGVAASWTVTDDGLNYFFYLRPEAQWHLTSNAQEQLKDRLPANFSLAVTAEDFVFALQRAVDPAMGSPDAYMFMNIENAEEIRQNKASPDTLGVYAVDAHTLQIRLARPQSNFLTVLAEPAAMPCSKTFFDACIGRYGTYIKFILSNGPFYLSRFDENSYRMNKSPDYHGEHAAQADYIWIYYVADRNNLLKDLADSEYSCAVLTAEEYAKLRVKSSFTVTEERNVLRSLLFNLNDPSLSDADLRHALAAATDTAQIADNGGRRLNRGYAPLYASSGLVGDHPDLYDEEKVYDYLQKALEALESTSVELTLLCEEAHGEVMKKLLQEWQKLLGVSVTVNVKTVTPQELKAAVVSGDYQIAFYPVAAHTFSSYEYFGAFTTWSGANIAQYTSATANLLVSTLYSGDDAKFAACYRSLEHLLAADAFMLPVWDESTYFVCTKGVKGIDYRGGDKMYFGNASKS